ncbi:CRISPR-associated endonuclease Cas1 [Azospirillum sp. TSO5]|uniref:CRISPR-associated endonuclease Cas4g/Cas1g n=1 Tax=Azospirillum sp. TSO5 TaxID=716760 RepID=UPI000D613BCA|nr:CRISPR-associated endonuclease Cas1 [Azospirillum sp. TSO5]PWC96010.1 CRISPR-associated protein Cas4 [Azospirillum sp. TSO5]
MTDQLTLPLPAPPETDPDLLVPARMVNEWAYCPRLAYLEWVEGAWAANADTEEGKRAHARVDAGRGTLPPPEEADSAPPFEVRSIELASDRLGLVAKMDVIEGEDGVVTPIDFKKGKRPHVEGGAYEPERVQLCVQALVLEDNGYRVGEGFLWFAGSRERVPVVFDEELRARTREAASGLRLAAAARRVPPPLDNSRKCARCSLLPICLPDEVNLFRSGGAPRTPPPAADSALPLYVQQPGARVGKKGDLLVISIENEPDREVPVGEVSELVLAGPVSLSTPALHALVKEEIPIAWMSSGFWFIATTGARGPRSAHAREGQYAARADAFRRLLFARDLVRAKLRNQRTIMRRNWRGNEAEREHATETLKRLADRATKAAGLPELLGVEGEGAAVYFRALPALFTDRVATLPTFSFERRSRRPPADPVNACLSLCYALLTRTCATALEIAGLDPWAGLYHADRPGRPALALDFMEPLRPILADSTVLTALNNGELAPADFITAGPGCNLTAGGRRTLIRAFERRLDQEASHPTFGYQISMRRMLHVQARLFARHLLGEIDSYPHYCPR